MSRTEAVLFIHPQEWAGVVVEDGVGVGSWRRRGKLGLEWVGRAPGRSVLSTAEGQAVRKASVNAAPGPGAGPRGSPDLWGERSGRRARGAEQPYPHPHPHPHPCTPRSQALSLGPEAFSEHNCLKSVLRPEAGLSGTEKPG